MGLLPTKPTPPKTALSELSILLYGPPKIGKSTFAASAPAAVFLACEPGLNHLETFNVPVRDWRTFVAAINELEAGKHQFKTVVIDTVDNAAMYCTAHVCARLGIDDPSDMGYGKGFGAVKKEWTLQVNRLCGLPMGVIFISHCLEKEVEVDGGKSAIVLRPSIKGSQGDVVAGLVDTILFATADREGNRVLRTRPNPRRYEAGSRTRVLPDPLPLEWAALEAAVAEGMPPAARLREAIVTEIRGKRWTRDQVAALLATVDAKTADDVDKDKVDGLVETLKAGPPATDAAAAA